MYINTEGSMITEAIYDTAAPFSEHRALVSRNGLYGYIDPTGHEIIKCQYGIDFPNNSIFSDGLAAVRFNKGDREEIDDYDNNFGYINTKGDFVFEPEHYNATPFSEGFAMIKNAFDYYFITKKGEIPFDIVTQVATSFSEGLASMYNEDEDSYGYINTRGEWQIPSQYQKAYRFTEGLAAVKKSGMKGFSFINSNAETIISGPFKLILPFKNGLAYVEEKNKKGYINTSGTYVWSKK